MAEGNKESTCSVCENLDVDSHADRWQVMQDKSGHQRIVKYLDLKTTASTGCRICSSINEGIEAFQDVLGQLGKETEVYFRCQPLHPLEVGVLENKNRGCRWLEFFSLTGKYIETQSSLI
jgi:hypothetical protein